MISFVKGLMGGVDAETLKRAGKRAGFHMLKASLETLKAVEAVVEELRVDPPKAPPARQRIDVE